MAYILGLVLVGIFFVAMRKFTTFDTKQQISIVTVILAIVAVAIMYNRYTEQENQKLLNVTLKFNQGKTIKCKGRDVNSSNYSLSIGTYTFIGKKNTANFEEMISASDCK